MSWDIVRLGEASEIIAGQSPPSETYNKDSDGLPFYQGKADFGYLYPITRSWCKLPIKIAKKNDILISVRAPVGPTNICGEMSCIGRGLSAIRAKENLHYKFLLYYLRMYEPKLSGSSVGSTFSAITQKDLHKIQIPLPPLPIQKKIAAVLDKADELRRKRKQAIAKLDELLQSVFLDMFGDPVTNPKGWEVKKLGEVAIFSGGGTPSKSNKSYYQNGSIPWVSPKDMKHILINDSIDKITERAIKESSTKLINNRSVLIVVRSGILKKVIPLAISNVPLTINQDMKALTPKNGITPTYLLKSIKLFEQNLLKTVRATTADNLNTEILRNLLIPIAEYSLQEKYDRLFYSILKNKENILSRFDKIDSLFNSLLQRAFKGDLEFNDSYMDKYIEQMDAPPTPQRGAK